MGRPDFDASASDSDGAADSAASSIENAYFGAAGTDDSNLGTLHHGDQTSLGHVFGTRTEDADGTA